MMNFSPLPSSPAVVANKQLLKSSPENTSRPKQEVRLSYILPDTPIPFFHPILYYPHPSFLLEAKIIV